MAISILQKNSAFSVSSVSSFAVSFLNPCTPGSFIVALGNTPSAAGSGIKDGVNNSGGFYTRDVYSTTNQVIAASVQNTSSNTLTVTQTYGGAFTANYMAIYELAGMVSGAGFDQTNTGTGTNQTAGAAGNITTTATDFIVAMLYAAANYGTPSAGTGYTLDQTQNVHFATEYWLNAPAGTYNPNFTWTIAENWTVMAVSYKSPAAAGSAGQVLFIANVGMLMSHF